MIGGTDKALNRWNVRHKKNGGLLSSFRLNKEPNRNHRNQLFSWANIIEVNLPFFFIKDYVYVQYDLFKGWGRLLVPAELLILAGEILAATRVTGAGLSVSVWTSTNIYTSQDCDKTNAAKNNIHISVEKSPSYLYTLVKAQRWQAPSANEVWCPPFYFCAWCGSEIDMHACYP